MLALVRERANTGAPKLSAITPNAHAGAMNGPACRLRTVGESLTLAVSPGTQARQALGRVGARTLYRTRRPTAAHDGAQVLQVAGCRTGRRAPLRSLTVRFTDSMGMPRVRAQETHCDLRFASRSKRRPTPGRHARGSLMSGCLGGVVRGGSLVEVPVVTRQHTRHVRRLRSCGAVRRGLPKPTDIHLMVRTHAPRGSSRAAANGPPLSLLQPILKRPLGPFGVTDGALLPRPGPGPGDGGLRRSLVARRLLPALAVVYTSACCEPPHASLLLLSSSLLCLACVRACWPAAIASPRPRLGRGFLSFRTPASLTECSTSLLPRPPPPVSAPTTACVPPVASSPRCSDLSLLQPILCSLATLSLPFRPRRPPAPPLRDTPPSQRPSISPFFRHTPAPS